MNKRIRVLFYFFAFIVFLFVQCSSNRNSNVSDENEINREAVQKIHLPDAGETILKASYFADTVEYIPLETTKESLIKGIKDLWMNDSIILVSCWQNGLQLFRRDGQFLRKIGKKGKGPGEYLSIFSIEIVRDTIYVSSTGKRGFLRYKLDGSYCDEIKFNSQPVFFSTTIDHKIVQYDYQKGKALVYNKGFQNPDTIILEYDVTKGRYQYVTTNHFLTYFQKTSSGLLFNNYRNDTIWSIKGNEKKPAYILDLKDKLPYEKQIEFCKGDFMRWEEAVKSYHYVHLIPFSSCVLIFQLPWDRPKYDAIYLSNQKTGEIKRYNTSYVYDDIGGKMKLSHIHFIYNPNYLVAITEPQEIFENIEGDGNKEENPSSAFMNQMKKIKEDDNQILVLMKIKKNLP